MKKTFSRIMVLFLLFQTFSPALSVAAAEINANQTELTLLDLKERESSDSATIQLKDKTFFAELMFSISKEKEEAEEIVLAVSDNLLLTKPSENQVTSTNGENIGTYKVDGKKIILSLKEGLQSGEHSLYLEGNYEGTIDKEEIISLTSGTQVFKKSVLLKEEISTESIETVLNTPKVDTSKIEENKQETVKVSSDQETIDEIKKEGSSNNDAAEEKEDATEAVVVEQPEIQEQAETEMEELKEESPNVSEQSDVLVESVQPFAIISNFEFDTIDNKTTYLSGELIRFGVKANLTGQSNELERTSLEIKIPKNYVSKESINASDIVNQVSKKIETIGDYHVITYVLNPTNLGLSFNIPINFKTLNGETPSGYQLVLIANLYDKELKPLIAEIAKNFSVEKIPFTKTNVQVYQARFATWASEPYFSIPTGYEDINNKGFSSENHDELTEILLAPNIEPFSPEYLNETGKRLYSKFVLEHTIPKESVFIQELNPGWIYNSTTRVARYEYVPEKPLKNFDGYTFNTFTKRELHLKLKFPGIKSGTRVTDGFKIYAYPDNKEAYETVTVLEDTIQFYVEAEKRPDPVVDFTGYKYLHNSGRYIWDEEFSKKINHDWSILVRNKENKEFFPDRKLENIVVTDKDLDENLKFINVSVDLDFQSSGDTVFTGADILVTHDDGSTEVIPVEQSQRDKKFPLKENAKSFVVTFRKGSYLKAGGGFSVDVVTAFRNPSNPILDKSEERRELHNSSVVSANYEDTATRQQEYKSGLSLFKLQRKLKFEKKILNKKDIYQINDEITYSMKASHDDVQKGEIVNTNKILDLLPAGVEYVEGSTTTTSHFPNNYNPEYRPFSADTTEYDNSDPEIIENYQETGKTALIWKIANYQKLDFDRTSTIFEKKYRVKITSRAISGVNTNKAYLSWKNTDKYIADETHYYNPSIPSEDIFDLNENGQIDDMILSDTADFLYESPTEVSTVTNVKGNLDSDYVEKSEVGLSEINSKTTHKYSITNSSASDLKTMYIMDLLPDIGDKTASIDQTLATPSRVKRNSTFKLRLQGPVVSPTGFDVFYTEDPIPEDIPDFTKNATWVSSVADYSKVTAFKLVLQSGTLFKSGETRTFEVPFDIPQDTTLDSTDQAVNSFGVAIDDTLKYFESNNSTTQIVKYAMDGYVFEDENENGVFDQGTETLFSDYIVQLVDERGVVATDLDGNPYEVKTNSDGYYAFDVYRQGTYKIKIATPIDHVVTKVESGPLGSDITDSEKGETDLFELNRATQKQEKNAGYHLEKGDVVVNYVDTKGNQLETLTLNGQVGKEWTSEQLTIDGYKFKEVKEATTGAFTKDPQTVTYVYYKEIPGTPIVPIVKGDVIVSYVDTKGKDVSKSITLNGQVGKSWVSEQKTFAGYKFKEVKEATSGLFTKDPQTVTYVYYKEIPGTPIVPIVKGDVVVSYVDTKGKDVSKSITLSGQVGKDWVSEQLTIDGYKFKEVKGDTKGIFTEAAQEVTYIYYTKIPATPVVPIEMGEVVVNYVDTKGNILLAPITLNGQIGKDWRSTQEDFAGYKFKEVKGDISGAYTTKPQEVTYIYYTKIPSTSLEPSTPIKPENPVIPGTDHPLEPSGPTDYDQEETPGTAQELATPDSSISGENGAENNQERLPQTGMNTPTLSLYVAVAFFLGGLFLLGSATRKEKE
ncbi:MucBP domain-containing protein [Carnobacterium maltaromaticum]|uniref:MucBP domain-containing protein n=1 Tax=Carnobacterium maltaromaticum TaxID=2751 RepID=UPI00165CC808|nr:MucBP domain-containing protein [Carnobacterium maltaromaticum]MBC9787451.1 hypothetical protein [Carnobacterium maltaromaticum]